GQTSTSLKRQRRNAHSFAGASGSWGGDSKGRVRSQRGLPHAARLAVVAALLAGGAAVVDLRLGRPPVQAGGAAVVPPGPAVRAPAARRGGVAAVAAGGATIRGGVVPRLDAAEARQGQADHDRQTREQLRQHGYVPFCIGNSWIKTQRQRGGG